MTSAWPGEGVPRVCFKNPVKISRISFYFHHTFHTSSPELESSRLGWQAPDNCQILNVGVVIYNLCIKTKTETCHFRQGLHQNYQTKNSWQLWVFFTNILRKIFAVNRHKQWWFHVFIRNSNNNDSSAAAKKPKMKIQFWGISQALQCMRLMLEQAVGNVIKFLKKLFKHCTRKTIYPLNIYNQ